jgi:hypothetical protein
VGLEDLDLDFGVRMGFYTLLGPGVALTIYRIITRGFDFKEPVYLWGIAIPWWVNYSLLGGALLVGLGRWLWSRRRKHREERRELAEERAEAERERREDEEWEREWNEFD